jgi:hypothetical protein
LSLARRLSGGKGEGGFADVLENVDASMIFNIEFV